MPILTQGLVQVYTGDGKGKTTAAIGLACRMLGAGGRVYCCQFLKPHGESGEGKLAAWLGRGLVFDRVDQPWDMGRDLADPTRCLTMRSTIGVKLGEIESITAKGEYDMVILDELVYCLSKGLAEWSSVERIIDRRARHVELVLTGRGVDQKLIDRADLVSEIHSVKHPYQQSISARRGIEF
jgi:cob(I)alamin adenosyltransferase